MTHFYIPGSKEHAKAVKFVSMPSRADDSFLHINNDTIKSIGDKVSMPSRADDSFLHRLSLVKLHTLTVCVNALSG